MPGPWEFPYTSFNLRPSPAFPEGRRILRPVVTTLVVCPRGFTALDAIIDTGADHCVFPLTTARELGLDMGFMETGPFGLLGGAGLFDTFSVRLDKWRGTFTIFPKE